MQRERVALEYPYFAVCNSRLLIFRYLQDHRVYVYKESAEHSVSDEGFMLFVDQNLSDSRALASVTIRMSHCHFLRPHW